MPDEIEENVQLLKEMLRSGGWAIFANEIILPLKHDLETRLHNITVENAGEAPVLAGQLRFLDKVLGNVKRYIEEGGL